MRAARDPSATASATRTASANGRGRKYGETSMIAGGRPLASAKRTLPPMSPWITWRLTPSHSLTRRGSSRSSTARTGPASPAYRCSPTRRDRRPPTGVVRSPEERGPRQRHVGQSAMERVRHRQHVLEAARFVGTFDPARGGPTVDRVRAVGERDRARDPELGAGRRSVEHRPRARRSRARRRPASTPPTRRATTHPARPRGASDCAGSPPNAETTSADGASEDGGPVTTWNRRRRRRRCRKSPSHADHARIDPNRAEELINGGQDRIRHRSEPRDRQGDRDRAGRSRLRRRHHRADRARRRRARAQLDAQAVGHEPAPGFARRRPRS